MDIDALDKKILQALSHNGRTRWADLAATCGVSSPAIAARVRRLEKRGVIQGYTALLSPEALGQSLMALIFVTLEHPKHRQTFLEFVQANPAIQECHHITGEGDYLLKVRCSGTAQLEHILSDCIKGLPGIQQTRTSIALSTVKETPNLPIL